MMRIGYGVVVSAFLSVDTLKSDGREGSMAMTHFFRSIKPVIHLENFHR